MNSFLKTRPVFFLLLPVFFVFKGFNEHYGAIRASDALALLGTYLLAALIIFLTGWIFYRNAVKAALFAFTILALNFFFGTLHDLLKQTAENTFLSKYSFVIGLMLAVLLAVIIILKRRKKPLSKIT